jgi:hypothetical protein
MAAVIESLQTAIAGRPRRWLTWLALAAALGLSAGSTLFAQTAPLSAAGLMQQVVANELTDRVQQRKWHYLIDRRDGVHTLTEEQVDTRDGPIFRMIAIDGAPLSQDQRQQDNARMDRLLYDPILQIKSKLDYDEDEAKLEKVLHLMPLAFLYDYDGTEGDLLRIRFRPNTGFTPPTYEARVVHTLAGTLLIDPLHKRLARFSGKLMDRVEFGYGLLGYIEKGGTIEIGRTLVEESEWKTTLVNISLSGRMVFFKTINKQEHETRTDFHAVSGDISLLAASQLLSR